MQTSLLRVVLASIVLVIILTACGGEPEYTPDAATIAAREEQEYDASVRRRGIVADVAIVLLVTSGAVLIYWVYKLGETRYKIEAAKAQKAEAEARRLEFISLGDGKAYDTRHRAVIAAAGVASQLPPVMPAEALPPTPRAENKYAEFIRQAKEYHPDKWQGKTIPHWDKMGMSSNKEWMAITDVLAEEGLIDKSQGRVTTITEEQTLGWLYNLLTHSPIDY